MRAQSSIDTTGRPRGPRRGGDIDALDSLTQRVNTISGVDIAFQTEQLAKLCNESKALRRKYGAEGEKLVRRRLDDLRAAPSLAAMAKLPAARCEELKGNRAGELSVRLHGGYRLIFRPGHDPVPRKPDGGLDWTAVTVATILGIEDYHD